jgi:hypothetical protein
MKYLITFILLFSGHLLRAQDSQSSSSIIWEEFALLPVQSYQSDFPAIPFSLYYNWKSQIAEGYKLELRPGFLMMGDYLGWELGAFLRKDFSKKFFSSIGVNLHFNRSDAHGAGSYTEVYAGPFLSVGVTGGVNLGRTVAFLVSVYKPFMTRYGYFDGVWYDNDGRHSDLTEYKFSVMIKIGFEFTL